MSFLAMFLAKTIGAAIGVSVGVLLGLWIVDILTRPSKRQLEEARRFREWYIDEMLRGPYMPSLTYKVGRKKMG